MEAQEEQRLARGQREYLDLEIRKFRRKKLLIFHSLEQELLREVCIIIDILIIFQFFSISKQSYFHQNLFPCYIFYLEYIPYELIILIKCIFLMYIC